MGTFAGEITTTILETPASFIASSANWHTRTPRPASSIASSFGSPGPKRRPSPAAGIRPITGLSTPRLRGQLSPEPAVRVDCVHALADSVRGAKLVDGCLALGPVG